MRRTLFGSLVGILLAATSGFAAEAEGTATTLAPAVTAAAASMAQRPEFTSTLRVAPGVPRVHRPGLLPALYVGSASLQAFDAYSTLSVLEAGGREQNPLMKGVVKSPATFIAVKAGITAVSIVAAERLWKNNNRLGAVLLMAASNGMMAYVAAHNASVLARVR